MRARQSIRDLRRDLQHLLHWQRSPGEHFPQRVAVDVLHDDVRMIEGGGGARFVAETGKVVGVGGEMSGGSWMATVS